MGITLKQLRHAHALAKHGNFRRAAASQRMTQPAFSRSIQMLEAALDAPLFDRLSDRIEVTAYGETLLRRAETILLETDEIEREIALLKGLEQGDLSPAMGIYPADICGNLAVAELAGRYPRLRCHVTISAWPNVIDLVKSRRADIGFAEISVARDDPELQVVPSQQHAVVLFARRGHPLAAASHLSKTDLDHFPLATVRLPPRVRDLFPGISHIDSETGSLIPSLEVDNMDTMRTLVLHSDAFGMAAPVQITRPAQQSNFAILPFNAPWMHLDQGLIFLKNRTLPPAAQHFMEIVLSSEQAVAHENQRLMRNEFAQA